ncbi:DUF1571 domain-containing protein [Rhodopirellula baltica]|uniref:Secreted protein containing DUF1571 n=2 Tax=Rhodopirellula baltica TaxID=265606 RepID=F2AXF1_RHOBT|nr:DUF1571 domain-containing protein [Rhodopirellula baltica]EGF25664.1 secreted protein containing DUF1571 [Rhodopirellula baltica WH47]ELP33982.1 secreted protein containing DUF1571 [Rhodopirellula baltica SWK14]
MNTPRRQFLGLAGGLLAGGLSQSSLFGQDPQWTKPVHRVANAALSAQKAAPAAPVSSAKADLVRGLEMARQSLTRSKTEVNDYTAILVKRERIGDTVGEHEYMSIKVRNRKEANGRLVQPFSVYLSFLKPSSVKGREVIYVENQNNGNIVAHEGGFKGRFLPTVSIPPTGMLAMRGQRYPMTEIGVENMILKLIERGEKALQFEDVHAEFRKGARLKDRSCTVLQLTQPTRRPDAEFHTAQVFMDDELDMPIRYIAYDWPNNADGRGEVIEEYNYLNLKVNVGLTDADFDPYNKDYNFHS